MSNIYYLDDYRKRRKEQSFQELFHMSYKQLEYMSMSELALYNKMLDAKYEMVYNIEKEDK